jgi:hypothetical protein
MLSFINLRCLAYLALNSELLAHFYMRIVVTIISIWTEVKDSIKYLYCVSYDIQLIYVINITELIVAFCKMSEILM